MFFIIYKFIINLLIPPGTFLLLLVLIIYFIQKRKYKFAKISSICTLIFIYLLTITPVKDIFVIPLENNYAPISIQKILESDGIIVLGGGVYENIKISLNQVGQPSQTAIARLNEAVRIYNFKNKNKQSVSIFLSGGSVYSDAISEAEVYKEYIVSLDVEPQDVFLENKSKTTFENILFLKELLKEKKIRKPILVTSATHMKRGMKIVEHFGINIVAAPCDYVTARSRYNISDFFPSAANIGYIKKAIWEYIGLIYYDLKIILQD